MQKLRLILLILFITCAACDVNQGEAIKTVEATTASVKLTKVEGAKSKTEKRDSSDQTASYLEKAKDEPFRPIFRPQYHDSPNFRPTTVHYVAAEATPQVYYGKGELMGGIQYANPSGGSSSSHNVAAASVQQPNLGGGGGHYASSAYRVLPQQQAHATQAAHANLPQQVKISAAAAPPPSPQYYAYAEPEMNYMHERLPLHVHQAQRVPSPPHHHQHQQHQIQYVIAIPLSYVRQLQQQLSAIPTHASQAYALPAAASAHQAPAPLPRPMLLQAIGPLARDHQGAYRPFYHQHYAAAEATSSAEREAAPAPVPPGYTTQYIQIPAGLLLAATQAATRQQRPPPYQQLYYMPQHHAQPTYQQHYQQPQQLQPIYAHYGQQQSAQLQQPQQQQLQLKQQQQQPTVVRIGGVKPSDKLSPPHISSSATPAAAAIASSPNHSAVPSPSPIVHYNPYYVQAPPPPQEKQQQPSFIGGYNYARYVPDQHGSTAAHPLIRLSSPSALLAPQTAAHYHYHTMSAPLNYAAPVSPSYATHENGGVVSAAHLPYFYHPGGIHYGTHLYHPPTPTTPSKTLEASVGNHQQQKQQQHQQPHQQQLQQQYQPRATSSSTVTTIANGAAGSVAPTVVKYP